MVGVDSIEQAKAGRLTMSFYIIITDLLSEGGYTVSGSWPDCECLRTWCAIYVCDCMSVC